nr:winged helix-turn-helix transcriptional regulator [Halomonas nanhaiensis]
MLFHLFDGNVQCYSDFEKLIPGISQKMLAQQLRQLEADGIVARKVYPQVPPKVEYRLTEWGQTLCPALDALLKWAEQKMMLPTLPSRTIKMMSLPVESHLMHYRPYDD